MSAQVENSTPSAVRPVSLVCPICGHDIKEEGGSISCSACGHKFPSEAGIPLLFWPNDWDSSKGDVTESIKAFYEKDPFPNYDDLDTSESLREKASRGIFGRLLDEQIPHGSKVLEVGCGTGQLSNFLGLTWGRTIVGSDMCLNSLKLANGFKTRQNIASTSFVQMNLFRPVFKEESFDFVICNGVLHHTSDPPLGFKSISKLVKKGGHILIGLYHKHGRIFTDIRRVIFRLSGNRFQFLDPRLRIKSLNQLRKHTWFMDQYKNPHESKHTFGEVLRWFEESGFSFVHSIPRTTFFDSFSGQEKLFEPVSAGSTLDRFLVQARMLLTGDNEGGFFIMIGQKK